MNAERINALWCAVHELEGIDGGYSPAEKEAASKELRKMLAEEEKKEE